MGDKHLGPETNVIAACTEILHEVRDGHSSSLCLHSKLTSTKATFLALGADKEERLTKSVKHLYCCDVISTEHYYACCWVLGEKVILLFVVRLAAVFGQRGSDRGSIGSFP